MCTVRRQYGRSLAGVSVGMESGGQRIGRAGLSGVIRALCGGEEMIRGDERCSDGEIEREEFSSLRAC